VLTKNEAARLPHALASIPSGARVFILDAESADATVAIARTAGAAVESRPWAGFVDARRYALDRVATDWTLMLDADEALDETLRAAVAAAPGDVDAYVMRRITTFCGRRIRTAGWSNEKLVRLFRTSAIRLEAHSVGGGADLHERWVSDGRIGALDGAILHDSYPTLASYREKFARYTSIEAAAVRGSAAALAASVVVGLARFPWAVLRYGGWNDGWRGIFVAFSSASYPVVVQYKALRRK
jgi:glycosyltransferase involved in cell wall biosynthesis